MFRRRAVVLAIALCPAASMFAAASILYRSDAFLVRDSSVHQGPFSAYAVDRDTLVSTYPRAAQEVMFKFSINGRDNEFPPGTDHMIYIRPQNGRIVTPVYKFAVTDPPLVQQPTPSLTSEEGRAEVTFRLDMRDVLESFRKTGVYDPPHGRPIKADEFEGVYIAGNFEPLGWDFSVFKPGSKFELTDPDGDGIYTVTLPFEATYTRPVDEKGNAIWRRTADLSRFPEYTSEQPLIDAVYRLSLEELLLLMRDDGAIVAGAKWPDVWTRDLAWGTIFAFAPLLPDQVKTSLLMKVDREGRIVQDTGTGGSWPVSTDRMAWAVAAWELFKVTGDREWLRTSFDIIRRSAEADLHGAYDEETGLFRGESSFLDWRDQSYPAWMDARDIYHSQTLGTNALHYAAWDILAQMARLLGEPSERYEKTAARLRDGMNTYLWDAERGWYGQFRYGRNHPVLSPRAEGLGEAFTILFGIAGEEQRARLARRNPVVAFGVPSFWPYIAEVPPYHNAGIWPQVVGFWTWAAAEAKNASAVEHGLASMVRSAALFLTNKENMVAATGHFEGTELNSDRLVGSVGATLASVQRVLLGMRFLPDRLVFEPFIPVTHRGTRTFRGLRYRDAVIDVTIRGFGDRVWETKLDGRVVERAEIPANLRGRHTIEIAMDGSLAPSTLHLVENAAAPAAPVAKIAAGRLVWDAVPDAVAYAVFRNGQRWRTTTGRSIDVPGPAAELAEYQVLATGADGHESFLSEPVPVAAERIVRLPDAPVKVTADANRELTVTVDVERRGLYSIDFRYANGSGPVNSSNRAAIRTLLVDGEAKGVVVMPQRGMDLWDDFGYSSRTHVDLAQGKHTLTIRYTPHDRNMSPDVNEALIDAVRLVLLKAGE